MKNVKISKKLAVAIVNSEYEELTKNEIKLVTKFCNFASIVDSGSMIDSSLEVCAITGQYADCIEVTVW